jgi:hypothetical protein
LQGFRDVGENKKVEEKIYRKQQRCKSGGKVIGRSVAIA